MECEDFILQKCEKVLVSHKIFQFLGLGAQGWGLRGRGSGAYRAGNFDILISEKTWHQTSRQG